MKDLFGALKRVTDQQKQIKGGDGDRDFKLEMNRLEKMVDILSSFLMARKNTLIFP